MDDVAIISMLYKSTPRHVFPGQREHLRGLGDEQLRRVHGQLVVPVGHRAGHVLDVTIGEELKRGRAIRGRFLRPRHHTPM